MFVRKSCLPPCLLIEEVSREPAKNIAKWGGGRGRVEEPGKMQGKRSINTHSKTHPSRGRGEGLTRLCLQFQCQKPSLLIVEYY